MIQRLCIIGVGLIGGSVAKGARRRGLCREIIGVDVDPANLQKALALGVIDWGAGTPAECARDADFVLIATPVGSFAGVFASLREVWSPGAVYTDAGSTKASVLQAARRIFGAEPANFVAGHPIAGAERSGVEAANSDLYLGKRVILTPTPSTDERCLQRVEEFWIGLGAKVSRMDDERHDAILAATSHLPHILAYTLMHLSGRKDEVEEIFQYAAGGFRDFTRIASSDPRMWLDICLANAKHILPLIAEFRAELERFADELERGDGEVLLQFFSAARNARRRFLDRMDQSPHE